MKSAFVLLGLGLFALMLQGSLALALPAHWVPDLGLLLVVAIALCVRGLATGVTLAAVLGFATDLLSGTLLGQHALLRMGAFAAARFGSARLNLRGPLPQALFVATLSLAHAAALWGLLAFFLPEAASPFPSLREMGIHALVNGLVAPGVTAGVAALVAWLEGDDGMRPVRLEPRTYSV